MPDTAIDEILLEPVYRVQDDEQLAFYLERKVDVHARLDEIRHARNVLLDRNRIERHDIEQTYNPSVKALRQKEVELRQAIDAYRGRQRFRLTAPPASTNGGR